MTVEPPSAPSSADRPRPDGTDIRKVTPDDVPVVARTLAGAFEDDPHFAWIIRDPGKRPARLERAFALFVRQVWLPHDEGYTHQHMAGAALWMPPDTWHTGVLDQLRLGPAAFRILRADTPRLLKALTFIERKHPKTPKSWYLPIIGVAPPWQGRGFGAALLRPMLSRLDQERTPAYLEASTPRNRALYERHGFEVMEECTYADDAPLLWRMWREPAAV